MSQNISIANKPKIADNIVWRYDGEDNQIIVLAREDLPLPVILNLTAAKIFSLCNGETTVEAIAGSLGEEFKEENFSKVLEDVKKQVEFFRDKGIVNI